MRSRALTVGLPNRDWVSEYSSSKAQLPEWLRLELDLIEERIITDPDRSYQRRYIGGTVVDFSGLDEHGIEVAYITIGNTILFIGFTVTPQ